MKASSALFAGASPRAMFASMASTNVLLRGPQVAYAPEDDTGAAPPSDGPLSFDEAVAAVRGAPEVIEDEPKPVKKAQPAPAAAAETDEDDDAGAQVGEGDEEPEGAASVPEDAEEGDETPADGEEAEEGDEAVELKEPPKYWTKEAKAEFAKLPPALQEVVLAQEGPREEAAAKAKEEAKKVRETADAEIAKVTALGEALSDFLPTAVARYNNKWKDVDWAATHEQLGADKTLKLRLQMEEETHELEQLQAAQAEANQTARLAARRADFEFLKTNAPHLADEKTGPAKRKEIVEYAVKAFGLDPAAAAGASAINFILAEKAMLYDRAQAAAAKKPKPAPAPAKPAVRPSGTPERTSQQRSVEQHAARLNKTGSVDDAVALLKAQRRA
ncbi:hypothetical protein [Caulobacter sp. NIBR2454]|uniref:hypothetical protein n=1 Tax=Caulobacter sp. NIBR2454 TaxID=3015996 RepID=UPI0022B5E739|nr:hypothetical protein [Caulobacter sp. NIBR2454]